MQKMTGLQFYTKCVIIEVFDFLSWQKPGGLFYEKNMETSV